MPVAVSEIYSKSEAGSIQANGARTLRRKFQVTGTTVLETALSGPYATGTMPNPSGVDTLEIGGETATYWGTRSWSRPDGLQDTWIIECEYTTAPNQDTSAIETFGDTRASTKSVYRTPPYGGWREPAGSWDSPYAGWDVGGWAVDSGGTPTSVVSLDRRFETIEKVDYFQNVGAYDYVLGRRNRDYYEGGQPGTILYLGFSWSFDTTTGLWILRHQFAVDQFTQHAEQVAKTGPTGEPIKIKTGSGDAARFVARHVYWVQPFGIADFGILPDFPN